MADFIKAEKMVMDALAEGVPMGKLYAELMIFVHSRAGMSASQEYHQKVTEKGDDHHK